MESIKALKENHKVNFWLENFLICGTILKFLLDSLEEGNIYNFRTCHFLLKYNIIYFL